MTNTISAENETGRFSFGCEGANSENKTEQDGAALHCSIAFVGRFDVDSANKSAGRECGLLRFGLYDKQRVRVLQATLSHVQYDKTFLVLKQSRREDQSSAKRIAKSDG